jgi:four helix bundle protein
LAADVYQLTNDLPSSDRSGVAGGLQQAALDIPLYIAAGHKSGKRDTMRLSCERATSKADELETLLVITGQLYPKVPSNDILDQLEDIRQALEAVVVKLAPPKKPMLRKTL